MARVKPEKRPRHATALRLGGMVTARVLFAAFLVFATYNPTGRSWYHWMRDSGDLTAWKIVATGLLLISYGVVVPVVLRALGLGGLALTTGLTTTAIWVLLEAGYIDIADWRGQAWVALTVLAIVLGVGLGWMAVARILDGQLRTVDLGRP